MLLTGKVVVITGSNRGIGKSITEKFAFEGAHIFACARTSTEDFEQFLKYLQDKTGVQITPVYFDMADQEAMKEAVKVIKSFKLKVDILVNNMGIAGDTLFQMTKKSDAQHMMNINFFSTFEFTQYIIKLMDRKKDTSIVNISSIAAEQNFPGMVSYSASKAAIDSLTRTLSKELGAQKIRVNAVAPGFTETDMISSSVTSDSFLKNIVESTSFKRLAKPEEIANTALFLASDLSSYITGQVIKVDGGL